MASGLCGQRRPRSACAYPDQPARLHSLNRTFASTNRIIGYCRIYESRAKARMILCACAEWSESTHFVHVQRLFFRFTRPILYLLRHNKRRITHGVIGMFDNWECEKKKSPSWWGLFLFTLPVWSWLWLFWYNVIVFQIYPIPISFLWPSALGVPVLLCSCRSTLCFCGLTRLAPVSSD